MPDADWIDAPEEQATRPGPPAAPPDGPELYEGVLWRRAVGYLLDVLAVAVLAVCLWIALGLLSVLTFGLLVPLQVVAMALLPLAYHSFFIGRSGATPGMRALDLEVRALDGARCDYARAFLMTVLFYLTVALTSWLVLAVALFTDRRRTLHDLLAGTLVVRHSQVRQRPRAGAAGTAETRFQRR